MVRLFADVAGSRGDRARVAPPPSTGPPLITYLGFRLIEGFIARLPRRLAYALGVSAGTLAFPLLRRQRHALTANLRQVCPNLSPPALRALAWRNWLNHTKAWIDFFKIPRMDRRQLGGLLTAVGRENLEAAMAPGKGVIAVGVHMGSWELAIASWAAAYGEIGVMVEQIEPRRLFEHVFRLRSKMGIRVIPLSRTGVRDIVRTLRDRRMVVLAIDRDILHTGQPFSFFGRVASIPTGPVEVALRTGAPILPVFCIRDRHDRYVAMGERPLFLTPSGDHEADVRAAMERLLATFERYISMYPDQWHVLEPIWRVSPVPPSVTLPSPSARAAVGD